MSRTVKGYGWKPDLPDPRDFLFAPGPEAFLTLPDLVRLDQEPEMPEVYDQGQLGSCTANGIGAAWEFQRAKQGLDSPMPSRLFLYYNERRLEGSEGYDAGAYIRDGFKSLANDGICPETTWPYDIGRFAEQPPDEAYLEAQQAQSLTYERVRREPDHWQAALAARQLVVFGFTVFDSFEAEWPAHGVMPTPAWSTESVLGGHCTAACGYAHGYDLIEEDPSREEHVDEHALYWRVRNSWGTGWADGGYFWMPAYLTASHNGFASDFWTLTSVE